MENLRVKKCVIITKHKIYDVSSDVIFLSRFPEINSKINLKPGKLNSGYESGKIYAVSYIGNGKLTESIVSDLITYEADFDAPGLIILTEKESIVIQLEDPIELNQA